MSVRFLILSALLCTAASATAVANGQAARVALGKQLIDTNGCGTCHQSGGIARPLSAYADKPASELQAVLADPGKVLSPSATMPSYQGKLTPEQMAAVIAFIKAQR